MRYNRLFEESGFVPPTDHTHRLSAFVAETSTEEVPRRALDQADAAVSYALSAAFAAPQPLAQQVDALALRANGGAGGASTQWGTGVALDAASAAFSSAARIALSPQWPRVGERAATVGSLVAAALPLAEQHHASGGDLAAAIVLGFEVAERVRRAARLSDGLGATTFLTIGAAVAAARVLGFDERGVDQAIGVAAEHSVIPASTNEQAHTTFAALNYALRARDGVLVARAVEKGIRNQRDILDDTRPSGFFAAVHGETVLDALTEGLGSDEPLITTVSFDGLASGAVPPVTLADVSDIADLHRVLTGVAGGEAA